MQPYPPDVPHTLAELDLAVRLLGHLVQHSKLSSPQRERLKQLLGACPNAKQAALWKSELKALRSELVEIEGKAAG